MGVGRALGKGAWWLTKAAAKTGFKLTKVGAKTGFRAAKAGYKRAVHDNTSRILDENPVFRSSVVGGYWDVGQLIKAPEDIASYEDLRKKADKAGIAGIVTAASYLGEDLMTDMFRQFHDIGHEHLSLITLGNDYGEVHRFIDSAAGFGHREAFGHGLEGMLDVYKEFGISGIPPAALHNLQDFTTDQGIPIILDISFNLARMITSIAFVVTVFKTVDLIKELNVDMKVKRKCAKARKLAEKKEYEKAIAIYNEAFGLKAGNPRIDLAKGQLYVLDNNLKEAYNCFERAALYFGPEEHLNFNNARISAKGVAGLSANDLEKNPELEQMAVKGFTDLGRKYRRTRELSAALNYYYAYHLTRDKDILDASLNSLVRVSNREKELAPLVNLVIYAWSREAA